MAKDKETKELKTFDSREFLKKHGEAGTKFRYTDRVNVEVIADTKHLKTGKRFSTHKLNAEALAEAGIVKILK